MYVTLLEFQPLLEDVELAIKALNGATHDALSLRAGDGEGAHFMDIAGDGERFIVVLNRGGNELILTDPGRGEHEVEVDFPGGQAVEWPASQVVDLPTTLRAAMLFARTGELDPSVEWRPPFAA
jgi:hypothetical protein